MGLINPMLATNLGGLRDPEVALTKGSSATEEEGFNDDEDNLDDDDVDLASDSEEGELDIPKPLPKVLTPAQKRKKLRFIRILMKDRGDVLHTISPADVQPHPSAVTWDADPELLCSYNWFTTVDGSNTLFVPGGPSKWTPQDIPYTVPADKGFHPTDYNYVRQPHEPFKAVFEAMTLMNPSYDFNDIDVLADRNNLRVLLEFVQGKTVGPFRLDLYMIFTTLVIVRREDGFWRFSNGVGHGYNFEKHFTTTPPDLTDASSHYRAIRYRMGPLNVVCRFEADACISASSSPSDLTNSEAKMVAPPTPETIEPDLLQRPRFSYNAPFRVLQKGHVVPGNQILELKTRTNKDLFGLVSCQDQLWFGRTSHLYTGRYEAGTGKILCIKQEDTRERIKQWEAKEQANLQKLVSLLSMLRATLMPLRRGVLVREDPRGPITLHEMLGKRYWASGEAFQRHWQDFRQQRPYAQRGAFAGGRGGRGSDVRRGRADLGRRAAEVHGGRGGLDAQRGHVPSVRGHAGAQRGLTRPPLSPDRTHRSGTRHVRLDTDGPPEARSAAHRGGAGTRRGRGNASIRGKGNAE